MFCFVLPSLSSGSPKEERKEEVESKENLQFPSTSLSIPTPASRFYHKKKPLLVDTYNQSNTSVNSMMDHQRQTSAMITTGSATDSTKAKLFQRSTDPVSKNGTSTNSVLSLESLQSFSSPASFSSSKSGMSHPESRGITSESTTVFVAIVLPVCLAILLISFTISSRRAMKSEKRRLLSFMGPPISNENPPKTSIRKTADLETGEFSAQPLFEMTSHTRLVCTVNTSQEMTSQFDPSMDGVLKQQTASTSKEVVVILEKRLGQYKEGVDFGGNGLPLCS